MGITKEQLAQSHSQAKNYVDAGLAKLESQLIECNNKISIINDKLSKLNMTGVLDGDTLNITSVT